MKKINFKALSTFASQNIGKASKSVSKNSPLILTVLGVAGLGATAWLSFKAAKRVTEITDDLEYRRDQDSKFAQLEADVHVKGYDALLNDEKKDLDYFRNDPDYHPVQRVEVVKDLAGALALPVATGLLSISSIALSYYIMNNRVLNLAASLAAATAESAYYDKRFKKMYGNDEYDKFKSPVVEEQVAGGNDENGNEDVKKRIVVTKKAPGNDLSGRWFSESAEYTADDNEYNRSFIQEMSNKLVTKKFQRGYLVMNDVLDELGFERTRSGALMGWDGEMSFDLYPEVYLMDDGTGVKKPQIYMSWPKAKYIYETVDYGDRY